jgi:hypothetical protein
MKERPHGPSQPTSHRRRAQRSEPEGRKQAIERIISDIIEGAQSQW